MKKQVERKPPALRQEENLQTCSDIDTIPVEQDHNYYISSSPRKLKRKINEAEDRVTILKKKLKSSNQTRDRLKKKVSSLQSVVDALRKEKLISDTCSVILEDTFSGTSLEVMKQIVSGKPSKKYSSELKSFAMTLQFYSSKAYDYVRQTFQLSLPHPKQIRKWYSSVSADPGFTKPSFDALKEKVEESAAKNGKVICALTLDEMAIRKHVQWNGKSFSGYVDIGNGTSDSDSSPTAKNALVFMVVSLNDRWKVPIAYFFIDGLTGEEKANIVRESLSRLADIGVKITSVTCDGPSSHFTMFRSLGTNIESFSIDTHFPHPTFPEQQVYVMFDICHMLKLVRNTLADGGIIVNSKGEKIEWRFIEELHKLQENEGLRLANKIKKAHITNWKQQKMKVNLAAQVFSSSVADAIQYCHEVLKLTQFQNSEGTIEFIRIIDRLFDLLNSRTPYQKCFKSPVRVSNIDFWQPFLNEAFTYIYNLTDTNKNKMIHSRRKTGFIGFLVGIKSIQGLVNDLLMGSTPELNYILTYKLSQDHIELFFGAIRAAGGFNNNPTTIQFTAAYKRLLFRGTQMIGGKGNCVNFPSTNILSSISDMYSNNGITHTISDIAFLKQYGLNTDDPAAPDEIPPNLFTCSEYKEARTNSEISVNSFVKFKDRGGLCIPSSSVLKVCYATEKCLSSILSSNNLPQGQFLSAISTFVLANLNIKLIFTCLDEHNLQYSFEENHILRLIKCICNKYSKIKLHHAAKTFNEKNSEPKIRKKLSKLILFKHE